MTSETDGSGYFLYHSIGQYPGKARDIAAAMSGFAAVWGRADGAQWPFVLGKRQAFIDRWRAILNAPAGSVTTAESVTAAVHAFVTAFPARLKGRRVLIAADCFPSVHFLLSGLAPRIGFTLDTVPLRPGAHWVEDEDFLARWGADVGLALLTWVSSTSSHRIDLAAMAAHGRRMGSLIAVDITQGAGLLPFDVNAPAIDFAASTSLKWMCGTPGAGILYIAPHLIAEADPEQHGWFSQPDPFSWALDRFSLAPDARRFDSGTPGAVAAIASLPALDWHAAADRAAILAANRHLSRRLMAGLGELGLPVASPLDDDRRGGSVMTLLPSGQDAAAVVAALAAQGLHADARGRTLRLSPGVMTTADGTLRLLDALGALLRR
ncbi:MAG: aminotransferase class V-fold PLP-dependent enzyme [Rhodobacteraceae bacterium]|nr:aminotransferase class V-fold PLP-dependent enzyme [Paracoccaceae bacterium]